MHILSDTAARTSGRLACTAAAHEPLATVATPCQLAASHYSQACPACHLAASHYNQSGLLHRIGTQDCHPCALGLAGWCCQSAAWRGRCARPYACTSGCFQGGCSWRDPRTNMGYGRDFTCKAFVEAAGPPNCLAGVPKIPARTAAAGRTPPCRGKARLLAADRGVEK